MKKIIWLFSKEIKNLKFFVFVALVIITAFSASLIGIFSVRNAITTNLNNSLDKDIESLEITANNVSADFLTSQSSNIKSMSAFQDKLTSNTELISDSEIFKTDEIIEIYGALFQTVYNGEIIASQVVEAERYLLSGKIAEKNFEITLSNMIAKKLEVKIGDQIEIDSHVFSLVGIFDESKILEENMMCNAYFYIVIPTNIKLEAISFSLEKPSLSYEFYNKLKSQGVSVNFPPFLEQYFNNIYTVNIFLLVIGIVMIVALAFVLYCFISILIRQRHKFIYQLNMLGISKVNLMVVYAVISALICFVAVIIATIFASLLTDNILTMLTNIFEITIYNTFSFQISLIVLVSQFVLVGLIVLILNIKLCKRQSVDLLKGAE